MTTKWVDPRHAVGWLFAISSLVWVFGTGLIVNIYRENYGDRFARKISLLAIFAAGILIGIYACVGYYQVFFIERRTIFIVWCIEHIKDCFEVRGYFSKMDRFNSSDIESVEDYVIQRRHGWKQIGTLLAWRYGNYKITLRDGRVFFIPSNMDVHGDLKARLIKGVKSGAVYRQYEGQSRVGKQLLISC